VLGILCEVSLKVPPLAAARQTLVFEAGQAEALRRVQEWAAAALPLRASAWQAGALHIRLEGARAAVESSSARLVQAHGARILEPQAAGQFWDALRDQRGGFFAAETSPGATLWRLSVPPTQAPLAAPGEVLVEWGGGQRWLWSDAPAEDIRALAAGAGGHATAFRGPVHRAEPFAPLAPALVRVHKALKACFDPAGIFNPGRLYPWL